LKGIRANGFHVETHCENGQEFLCITSNDYGHKRVLEKLMCRSSGLYATTIQVIESNHVIRDDLWDSDTYRLWQERLRYPGCDMMLRILKTSHGHPFFTTKRSTNQRLVQRVTSKRYHSFCKACYLAKIGLRPSYAKDTKIYHSCKESKVIFVDLFNQLADV
jgi:hypothetical protein